MLDPLTALRRTKNVAGFTLIELLVVVSIIALLIAILVPALRSAREQARVIACTANLKGIATASLTYATEDRHDQLVPVHRLFGVVRGDIGVYDWGGKAGRGEPTSGDDATSSIWGTGEGRGPATRPLNHVIFRGGLNDYTNDPGPNQANWMADASLDLPLFRCPSDRGYTGFHSAAWKNSGLTSYDHYGTSYAASQFWGELADGEGGCEPYSFTPFLRAASLVPNPANTIYYLENSGRFAWRVNYGSAEDDESGQGGCGIFNAPSTDGSPGSSMVKGWHRRPFHFVVSFVDGHAGVVQMRGRVHPAPHLSHYPALQGAEAGYWNYRCEIIRGPGWQIDTLPATYATADIDCELVESIVLR